MGNALEQSPHFFASKEEYLEQELKATYKSEYLQGEIVAMSGGSINHSTIGVNTVAAINN